MEALCPWLPLLSNLRSLYDRQVEAEKQLEAIQATRIKTQISTIQILDEEFNSEIEKKGELIDYNEKFNLEIFNIEQSYRDKQANLVDQAIQREIAKYETNDFKTKTRRKARFVYCGKWWNS